MYTLRLVFYSIRGEYNLSSLTNLSDEDSIITNSIRILGLGAVIGGSALRWSLFPECYIICLNTTIKMIVLAVRIFGGLIGYMANIITVNYTLKRLNNFSSVVIIGSMWFIPILRTLNLREKTLAVGVKIEKVADKG